MSFRKLLPAMTAAAMVLTPMTASAHTRLISSTPTANATASKVTSITMRFNEKLISSTVKADVVMTGMPGMTDHPPMKMPATSSVGKDGKSVTLLLKRTLPAGTYKVSWAAAGADTHRMSGSFEFTVK